MEIKVEKKMKSKGKWNGGERIMQMGLVRRWRKKRRRRGQRIGRRRERSRGNR